MTGVFCFPLWADKHSWGPFQRSRTQVYVQDSRGADFPVPIPACLPHTPYATMSCMLRSEQTFGKVCAAGGQESTEMWLIKYLPKQGNFQNLCDKLINSPKHIQSNNAIFFSSFFKLYIKKRFTKTWFVRRKKVSQRLVLWDVGCQVSTCLVLIDYAAISRAAKSCVLCFYEQQQKPRFFPFFKYP